MTPTEKFLAGPLVFMETNIVITPTELASADLVKESDGLLSKIVEYKTGKDGVLSLALEEMPASYVGKTIKGVRNGVACKVYKIVKRDDNAPDSFRAYWCPYKQGNVGRVVVKSDAAMLFTITLNGCSFGVGHAGSDGSRLVTHVNAYGKGGNQTGQAQLQKIMVRSQGSFGSQLIDPTKYREQSNTGLLTGNATVFGRINPITNDWIFHALKYDCVSDYTARTYTHKGLVDLLEVTK